MYTARMASLANQIDALDTDMASDDMFDTGNYILYKYLV